MTVYLAGPIEGISLEEATKWRETATSFFKKEGIETKDPTRRKKFHDQEYSLNLAKRIVRSDTNDIAASNAVLMNLKDRGAGKAWGTICELVIAQQAGKTIVVVLEEGFTHPFIDVLATELHHTLEDALEATLAYYR
jgi:nucleoside 2-deoxyribosyltransferase